MCIIMYMGPLGFYEEMLQYDPWVEALRKTALDNAVREEVAAQMMSLVAWTKWIH